MPRAWVLDCIRRRNELAHIHALSRLTVVLLAAASTCLDFLVMMNCSLESRGKINPFSPEPLSSRSFIRATGSELMQHVFRLVKKWSQPNSQGAT